MFTCRISTLGRKKEVVWLYSVRHGSSRQVETPIGKLSSITPKDYTRLQRYWQVDEAVRRRSELDVSTSIKAIFKLRLTKWNAHLSYAAALSGVGARLYKNILLR